MHYRITPAEIRKFSAIVNAIPNGLNVELDQVAKCMKVPTEKVGAIYKAYLYKERSGYLRKARRVPCQVK